MQYEQLTVPFERLVRDEANVRKKHTRESIEEMKASILAHDIIHPLAVRPPVVGDADLGGQLYRAFAGGRRWIAMGELIQEGKLPPDHPVPIVVRDVDDTTASELSLAENTVRQDMEPVDEFRAYAKLIDGGASAEDIALRFGKTDRYVKGRLALARLHPDILAAFEEGKLTFASACAYTTNPDPEVQVAYFRQTKNHWDHDTWRVKTAMRKTAVRADGSLAKFIGEETYCAAGGVVQEDLFGEDVYWISAELIPGLKAQAIETARQQAIAEGWSYFATTEEVGIGGVWQAKAISPESSDLSEAEAARMTEIEEQLEGAMDDDPENEKLEAEYEALEARSHTFTAEQKAGTGVILDLETLEWRPGCIKPKSAKGGDGDDAGADEGEPLATASKAAAKTKDPLALTQPLRDKVGETATDALKAAVVANPHKALALVAAMLDGAKNTAMGIGRPSRIKVERLDYGAVSAAAGSFDTRKAFDKFAAMSPDDLLVVFASLAAGTVDLTEQWFYRDNYTSDERKVKTRADFLNAFDANPVTTFDPEAWFLICTKPMIDAAMKEMTGHTCTNAKKSGMAREAAAEAKAKGWLPNALRTDSYTGPGAKAKARKAAASEKSKQSRAKVAAEKKAAPKSRKKKEV